VFIFDSESGDITGWNPAVPPPPFSTHAQLGTHVDGAIYKGLALATSGGAPHLYAANFHAGTVDVFDSTFTQVHLDGSFTDPKLPKGYAPFDVAHLNGQLYVAYAVQDANAEDEVAGPAKGIVDVFDTSGHFVRRLVSHGHLNAPWGMTIAPPGFGQFAGDLLVGNFGDGRISAYDPVTGAFLGQLEGCGGAPLSIDGLWGIGFGNGVDGQPVDEMYFAAGVQDEVGGLYGKLVFDRGC
jgi:uncharacterized protein (TIGR03118 family)